MQLLKIMVMPLLIRCGHCQSLDFAGSDWLAVFTAFLIDTDLLQHFLALSDTEKCRTVIAMSSKPGRWGGTGNTENVIQLGATYFSGHIFPERNKKTPKFIIFIRNASVYFKGSLKCARQKVCYNVVLPLKRNHVFLLKI